MGTQVGCSSSTYPFFETLGTTLFERHANPRAVQAILGHESLDVTMRYVSVIGQDTREVMELLNRKPKGMSTEEKGVSPEFIKTLQPAINVSMLANAGRRLLGSF